MPSQTKRRRSFDKRPKVARCEECKAIVSREQKNSCGKCSSQIVVNVNVEPEVTASHLHGRRCTEINCSNMAGTGIGAAENMNRERLCGRVGIQNVTKVEGEVAASYEYGSGWTEMNDFNMDGIGIDAVEVGNGAIAENGNASTESSPGMDLDYTSDSENSFVSEEEMEETEVIPWCYNCYRVSTEAGADMRIHLEVHPIYEVLLSTVSLQCGSFRRKFCTMSRQTYGDDDVVLCQECHRYLTEKKERGFASVFPAFMWTMLTNKELLQKFGDYLWALVPDRWRHWWLPSVQQRIPELLSVTSHYPRSVVKDVTIECYLIRNCLERNKLGELKHVLNEYFYPVIKCPWGCTEYHIHCGRVPFDILLRRIVGNDLLCFTDCAKEKFVRGIRDDFLERRRSQETFAWNPAWPVMPSVSFCDEDGQLLDVSYLTCRNHNRGSKELYFHPPRAINNTLPSRHGDQVAPVVVVPRILKSAQAKQYSNTYQMQSVRGHYGGVDSMSLTTHGMFDYVSPITFSNESAAIMGRTDIYALVHRWTEANLVMPPWLAKAKLRDAKDEFPAIEAHKAEWEAATFVTFRDAIRMQSMIRNEHGATLQVPKMVVQNNEDHEIVEYEDIHYKAKWPKWITFVHTCDEYGAYFPPIPPTWKDADHRLLWFLCGIHATIPQLWEGCVNAVRRLDLYDGWLLNYVMDSCYRERTIRMTSRDPFRYPTSVRGSKQVQEAFTMGMILGDETVSVKMRTLSCVILD